MPLLIRPGFAFTNEPVGPYPRHLHFSLTDAGMEPDGKFLLVNFTTDAKSGCPSLVVRPGEYVWLRHPSMIAFSLAALPSRSHIEQAIQKGLLSTEAPLPRPLVDRVRLALLASIQTEARIKSFLRARMA